MKDYTGKVVALTGAGSGLGKEVANRFGAHGAKLSLVDYNEERIKATEKEFKEKGYEVIVFAFDCSDLEKVEEWARLTFLKYGHVDFLFNNVGVGTAGKIWNIPLSDWKRTFEINVFTMVNGIHAFMPYFAAMTSEVHICNTASLAGLSISAPIAPYSASKTAAVSVSESLAYQCQLYYPHVKTHVWCPGSSPTNICYVQDQDLFDKSDPYYATDEFNELNNLVTNVIAAGYPISDAIDGFFEEFEADNFYICPAKHEWHLVQYKIDRILDKQRPVPEPLRK